MAVTFPLRRAAALALCALLMLASSSPAFGASASECSICATDCFSTYTSDVEDCGWRLWCQEGVRAERDACLGNCIIDGCGDYDWFPKPGGETGNDDFWEAWLL